MANKTGKTGVYPVFEIDFEVSTTGVQEDHETLTEADMVKIAEMETFELSIDGNVEEWSPMDTKGWMRRLMTGKAFAIALNGKRHEGDLGNDYIAGLAFKTGADCTTTIRVKFPNGDNFIFNCVVDVASHFGGDSTNVSALNFDLLSDGKPTYNEAGTGTEAGA